MKRNSKNLFKVIFYVTILCLLILPATSVSAAAAKYSIKSVEASLTGDKGETIATISYQKPVLKGESKEVKLINQSIEKDCKRIFDEHKDNLFTYAQGDYNNRTADFPYELHYCTYGCEMTKNSNDIISFKITWKWYAGGVSSTDHYGLTYSLKTGKALNLTDVVAGSTSEIKKKVMTASKLYMTKHTEIWAKDDIQIALDTINNYKTSDFKYYLKGTNAYICFDTYELAAGFAGSQIISIPTKGVPKINKSVASISIGKTLTLQVSGLSDTVKWETSNKAVATVSSTGKVSAKKAGKVTITGTVNGKSYTCTITVIK